jgi:hypothetical protein
LHAASLERSFSCAIRLGSGSSSARSSCAKHATSKRASSSVMNDRSSHARPRNRTAAASSFSGSSRAIRTSSAAASSSPDVGEIRSRRPSRQQIAAGQRAAETGELSSLRGHEHMFASLSDFVPRPNASPSGCGWRGSALQGRRARRDETARAADHVRGRIPRAPLRAGTSAASEPR